MKQSIKLASKTTALWVAMMFGTVLSGILVHTIPHPGIPDGPIPVFAALVLVNALSALVVAALARRLAAEGLRKAIILFVVVFALETGLSSIEATAFRQALELTPAALAAIVAAGLVRASVTAIAATLLWPRASDLALGLQPRLVNLAPLIVLYATLYFAAGMLVAWRSEAVRQYYHDGVGFNLPALLALQLGRGTLWTGLVYLLAANLRGRLLVIACWISAAFAVMMAAPLIYPSSIMPWTVRQVHLVELALSNGIFGFVGVLLLRRGPHQLASGRRAKLMANEA